LCPTAAAPSPVPGGEGAGGLRVSPPLEAHESFYLQFLGDGRYEFTYFLSGPDGKWQPLYCHTVTLPITSIGMIREQVAFMVEDPPISPEDAMRVSRAFIVPEDLGTPPGALSLRGATNFQTPQGWDTVYTAVFNMIERPSAPMLVVRVETDWYVHETEFRYVLQPGEGISATQSMPIGQVFFVPREEITLRDCTPDEVKAIDESQKTFAERKAAVKLTTAYGLTYSPHYLRESRSAKGERGS